MLGEKITVVESIKNNDNKPENIQKYENYKEQFKRLDRALKLGFYLEAIFIEYAIMEDRTSSILRYEDNSVKPKGDRQPSID